MFPPPEVWAKTPEDQQRKLIETLLAERGWEPTREYLDDLAAEDVVGLLRHLGGMAVKAGDLRLYTWTTRVKGDSARRCADRYTLYLWKDPHGTMSWIDCGRRACSYCGPIRTWRETAEVHRLLLALGGDIYRVEVPTRVKAQNVVDYATKLGHATVAIPVGPEETVVYTTMPRKDGHLAWALDVADGDPLRTVALEWSNPDFEGQVHRDISRIPAYRRDDENKRAMRMNKHMRQVRAEMEPVEPEATDAPYDEGERGIMSQKALAFAVEHGMVTEFWPTGEIKTIDTSKVDTATKADFIDLMRGGT